MRKIIVSVAVLLVLFFGAVYIFIPNIVKLKSTIGISATRVGLNRVLSDKSNVVKWWPGKVSNDSLYLHDLNYTINNSNITVLPISITGKDINMSTSLFLIEVQKDYTTMEWAGAMVTSYNPFKRVAAFFKAKKIEADMQEVLKKMESFYRNPVNIYGFDIKKQLVVDSTLIQTSDSCKGIPTNQFIYSLIDKLKEYATSQYAKESGYPMLNIFTTDSINFNVKVALPIDKPIPSSGNILQKRMLGMGNILVTEVKGGPGINSKAFEQIKQYADDYQRLAPAIPFYSLITDRTKESDTTKWITKIYYPVM